MEASQRALRIGIDTHAAEDEGTGNGSYVRGLVKAMTALAPRHRYFLYATRPQHSFYAPLAALPHVRVRTLRPRHPLWRVPVGLALASHSDALDVLHVQYVGPPLHRGALVVTVHDLAFLRVPKSFPPLLRKRLRCQVRTNVRRAAAVITSSEFSRADLCATYALAEDAVTVVPCAADECFTPQVGGRDVEEVRRRFGLAERFVLFIGRLNPRKNVAGLIDAFELVRSRQREPLQLVIAGRADFGGTQLTRRIEQSPHRRDIHRLGPVPDALLPALLCTAAVFVYPSFFEGFGLPPLEAMACGTPVICANNSSLPEVVGDAARLVDAADHGELARAIEEILSNPELRAQMSARGLAQAKRFDWPSSAERTLAVYRRAAAGPAFRAEHDGR